MIFKPLLAEQLRRFWAIPAFATIWLFLTGLFPIFSRINNEDSWSLNIAIRDVFAFNNFPIVLILIITPLMAVFLTMMSFVSKNEMTAFYSFPAKKSTLHFTNALAGIILTAVPIVVFCLILLIPIEYREPLSRMWIGGAPEIWPTFAEEAFASPAFPGEVVSEGGTINTAPAVLLLFARMMIVALFNFALFWFAFSIAGHGIIAFLLAGAIPLLSLLFPGMINQAISIYAFGAPTFDSVFPNWAVGASVPAFFWLNWDPSAQGLLIQLIAYSVVGIALAAAAFFISGRRRAENTGNSIMFKPVKNLMIFLASLAAAILTGMITWSINMSPAGFYPGFMGGFVIGYFISQMIAEKSFAIWHKAKHLAIFGGALVALYAGFYVFTQFGMGFYVNRVPAEENIVGVHASRHLSRYWGWQTDLERHFATDPEIIQMARGVHENLIAERANVRRNPWHGDGHPWNWQWHSGSRFSIDYLLDGGGVMQRLYTMPHSLIVSAGGPQLLSQREVILLDHYLLAMPEVIREIEIRHELIPPGGRRHFDLAPVYSSTITDREAITQIAAKLQDHMVEREIQWLDHIFFDAEVPAEGMFVLDEYADIFEVRFSFNWNLINALGIGIIRDGYQVSREFFDGLMEALGEMEVYND